ncbi:MAG: gamma carbonic anhydrase family protein [Pseudomonadota bacterium]|nr:gamma carbonic anhydrase family protein [Pseudomonadota bacterium]
MTVPAPVLLPYKGKWPKIDPTAFIAPGAVIIGDVEIGPDSSIWFGCVVRGDVNAIRIGARTNIQDGCVIHVASGLQPARLGKGSAPMPEAGYPTLIGNNVTVGHMSLLHACTVQDNGFVGMHAAVMDGATVESYAMLAAGAMLTPGKTIKNGELWAGRPAKLWRSLTAEDLAQFDMRATQYVELAKDYTRPL